jgi:hypothetical protein
LCLGWEVKVARARNDERVVARSAPDERGRREDAENLLKNSLYYSIVYRELNKSGVWEGNVKRTIIHLFEVRVGRRARRSKRVEDFLPQTTAHVAVHRKEVYHE